MADNNTVMKWLEICGVNRDCSDECPYTGPRIDGDECRENLMADALGVLNALLEEQEPVKPIKNKLSFTRGFDWDIWDCGCCGNQLRSFAAYCDRCGRAVKWDGAAHCHHG